MVDLILLSAGRGTRLGLGYPKQFARLRGKPIIVHTLEVFKDIEEIGTILVTTLEEYESLYTELITKYNIPKVILVPGGSYRQTSVSLALSYVETERVMIHEAVRPFITEEFIRTLLQKSADIVAPHVPISPAVCEIRPIRRLRKDHLREIQLPQVFNTKKLIKAHRKATDLYDEDSLLVFDNIEDATIECVEGLGENIKITTPLDLKLAEVLFDEKYGIDDRG